MTPAELAHIHALTFSIPRPWSEAEFSDLLEDPTIFLVTAPDGFALGRLVANEVELLTISIKPTAQGKGQGTQLLRAFLQQAKTKGAEITFLEVADNNHRAIGLYKKLGFTQIARRKDYYHSPKGNKISALIYNKPL